MITQIKAAVAVFSAFTFLGSALAEEAAKPECTTIVEHLTLKVKKDPSCLLLSVEDALSMNDKCACEIVSTAIKISKADSDLVGRIVQTSIQACPSAASSIAECALAAAPTCSASIKKAMQAAVGQGDSDTAASSSGSGKEVVSNGKDVVVGGGGKDVVVGGKDKMVIPGALPPTEDPASDPIGAPMNTSGVYLFTPSGGGGSSTEKETITVIKTVEKIKRVPVCECTKS